MLSFDQQIAMYLEFLRQNGLDVTELSIGTRDFIRCHAIGVSKKSRPDYCYKTVTHILERGYLGLCTLCRGCGGAWAKYKSYGMSDSASISKPVVVSRENIDIGYGVQDEAAARRAYGFWMHSNETGESDYLKRKGVGYYGIRFRTSEQYGNAAVVPMFDVDGRLWNRQLLNADGKKLMATDGRTAGLFHALKQIRPGQPFGIAESYATAATCMEITGMPVVCAFSGWNLKEVALVLSQRHPGNRIVIFADNDRHLSGNKGMEYAQAAVDAIGERAILLAPDFGDRPPSKDESDWNDMVRVFGREEAQTQLSGLVINT